MSERLDALLSAQRDGALEPAEQAELDRLLATSEGARARAAELARVDEALRRFAAALGHEPGAALGEGPGVEAASRARLARSWDAIARRRAATATATAAAAQIDRTTRRASLRRRGRGVSGAAFAAALAAGLVGAVLYGLRGGPPSQAVRPLDEIAVEQRVAATPSRGMGAPAAPPDAARAQTQDAAPDDGLDVRALAALEVAALGLEEADDVEVVAQLELLEYLAAREREAEEPRG